MLTKNELKYYSSLSQKKNRIAEGKFIIEGKKLVQEGLLSDYKCEIIISTNSFNEIYPDFVNENNFFGVRTEVVKKAEFNKLSDTKNPQGIVAVFHNMLNEKQISRDLIVALENISDPGNLGTIFRNCDWFGIKEIILSEGCAESYNPKVLRASMGSIFHLDLLDDKNFIDILAKYKNNGYEIVCSDLEGENLYEFKPKGKMILLFCNEANGPSEKLLSLVDRKITIAKRGEAESLNVASASAVVLYEVTKS